MPNDVGVVYVTRIKWNPSENKDQMNAYLIYF